MRGPSPTDCLRYINRNLGSAMQTIELSEDEIMRIVFQESIPTFSKYFPWHFRTTIDTNKNRVEGSMSRFYLNNDELNKICATPSEKLSLLNMYKNLIEVYKTNSFIDVFADYESTLRENKKRVVH